MKRLLILGALICLACTSCTKNNITTGLYFADTKDGLLYIELKSGNDCVLFFQGCDKMEGSYKISGNEIDLIGHASVKVQNITSSWWFGGSLGKGIISDGSFRIQSQRTFRDPEYYYLTFYKH